MPRLQRGHERSVKLKRTHLKKRLSYRPDGEKGKNMMYVIKQNGEEVFWILANHSMTLEEMIDLAGGEIINDMDDPRFDPDGANIIIDEKRYWFELLTVELKEK